MEDVFQVAAKVAKVSVGPSDGNQVARILRKGDIVPEGVPEKQLKKLVQLKLIKKADVTPAPAAEADAAVGAEPEADEKQEPTSPETAKTTGRKPSASK